MAEICLDCWNEMNGTKYKPSKYIMSDYLDLCESCGKWKSVIIVERRSYYMRKIRFLFFPLKVIYFIWRLLIIPYLLFKHYKEKNK